jgi:hypothetical protein
LRAGTTCDLGQRIGIQNTVTRLLDEFGQYPAGGGLVTD